MRYRKIADRGSFTVLSLKSCQKGLTVIATMWIKRAFPILMRKVWQECVPMERQKEGFGIYCRKRHMTGKRIDSPGILMGTLSSMVST